MIPRTLVLGFFSLSIHFFYRIPQLQCRLLKFNTCFITIKTDPEYTHTHYIMEVVRLKKKKKKDSVELYNCWFKIQSALAAQYHSPSQTTYSLRDPMLPSLLKCEYIPFRYFSSELKPVNIYEPCKGDPKHSHHAFLQLLTSNIERFSKMQSNMKIKMELIVLSFLRLTAD